MFLACSCCTLVFVVVGLATYFCGCSNDLQLEHSRCLSYTIPKGTVQAYTATNATCTECIGTQPDSACTLVDTPCYTAEVFLRLDALSDASSCLLATPFTAIDVSAALAAAKAKYAFNTQVEVSVSAYQQCVPFEPPEKGVNLVIAGIAFLAASCITLCSACVIFCYKESTHAW